MDTKNSLELIRATLDQCKENSERTLAKVEAIEREVVGGIGYPGHGERIRKIESVEAKRTKTLWAVMSASIVALVQGMWTFWSK